MLQLGKCFPIIDVNSNFCIWNLIPVSHTYHISITEEAVSCSSRSTWISQCIFFCHVRNAARGQTCSTRCYLHNQTRFAVKARQVLERQMALFLLGNETMQHCSSSVLTYLFLLPVTGCLQHQLWFCRSVHTPTPLCVNANNSGMLPLTLVGF